MSHLNPYTANVTTKPTSTSDKADLEIEQFNEEVERVIDMVSKTTSSSLKTTGLPRLN
ncbi:hypothetical protein DPMN_075331 [Dreissena polymorpha]|uniref:Uncharacterized protein n=1 Tax=Dreissena polymorpha TaxID=45954 RepID=A0A9D3YK57_DREPO|nr:hypothetical protein DPMN_075331 [Dreissena polymorpha]